MTVNPAFSARLEQRQAGRRVEDADSAHSEASDKRPCVLVVDDEPEITRSVAELLGRDYKVLTANSADEAVALLRTNAVAVILTDQRMPGGTGAELLAFSLAVAPDATRILFTGYSDISAVIEAVNEGQVYHYLTKPWRPDELRAVIGQGVARHQLVLENRRLLDELERANEELLTANREQHEFAYSIAHDLRSPLRALDGFSLAILDDYGDSLDETGRDYLARIRAASQRLAELLDAQLALAKIGHRPVEFGEVDVTALARRTVERLRREDPSRDVEFTAADGLTARTDAEIAGLVLTLLLDNAWKFTSKKARAHVEVGSEDRDGEQIFFVRDDGVGFDEAYASKLFQPFERLHSVEEYVGTGIGLASVRRVLDRVGGRCWAEGEVGKGAVAWFTLSRRP
jgi:signal transduction histidine kinase